jgi:hypothetical protein
VTLANSVPITGTAHNLYLYSGVLALTNTILTFEAAAGSNCFGGGAPKSQSGGHNVASDTSCGLTYMGDQQTVDPHLGPLADNGGPTLPGGPMLTRMPLSPSPAIDHGDDLVCAAAPVDNLDQRGFSRPVDGDGDGFAHCDVGAVEQVSVLAQTATAQANATSTPTATATAAVTPRAYLPLLRK